MGRCVCTALLIGMVLMGVSAASATAQELRGAGTLQGTVSDPAGGPMQAVDVK